mgnify:FL=1
MVASRLGDKWVGRQVIWATADRQLGDSQLSDKIGRLGDNVGRLGEDVWETKFKFINIAYFVWLVVN